MNIISDGVLIYWIYFQEGNQHSKMSTSGNNPSAFVDVFMEVLEMKVRVKLLVNGYLTVTCPELYLKTEMILKPIQTRGNLSYVHIHMYGQYAFQCFCCLKSVPSNLGVSSRSPHMFPSPFHCHHLQV